MFLLMPAALWALLLLPAVVLLHWSSRRPRRMVVPSLIPWRNAAHTAPANRHRRISFDLSLLLQLVTVAALILAIAGPHLESAVPATVPVTAVIDNSASMAAGNRCRDAIRRLSAEIGKIKGRLRARLYVTSPRPRELLGTDRSRSALLSALNDVVPTDAPGDLESAVARAGAGAGKDGLLLIASDDLSALDGLNRQNTVMIAARDRAGDPAGNLGIVAAALEKGQLFCAVRNAAPRREQVTVSARIGVRDGQPLVVRKNADIAAGGRSGFTFDLPAAARGFSEITLARRDGGPDALAADDRVWISSGSAAAPRAFCAPGKTAGAVLRALAALGFPAGSESVVSAAPVAKDTGLSVYCGLWPGVIPARGFALVIDPPAGGISGFRTTEAEEGLLSLPAVLSGDFFPHAGGYRFTIPTARRISAAPGGRIVLSSGGSPLIALSADGRLCVLAFDPAETEWVKHPSFPVFFSRLLEKSPALAAMRRSHYLTGEQVPAELPSGISGPAGKPLSPGDFLSTAGLYRAGGVPVFCANLLSEQETSCRLGGESRRNVLVKEPAGAAGRGGRSLASWFYLLALLALLGEWLLVWRTRPIG